MLNKIVIQGRLCADPTLRHTQSGTAVASFTLAVDRDFKNQDGEKEADFINCVAWKGTAETLARYFTKGRMAIVEGRLQSRKYTDKEGNNRIAYEVIASAVYFGDSKKDEGNQPAPSYTLTAAAPSFEDIEDDDGADLPF